MNIGMLWYDDDKKTTLREKLERAGAYYFDKYKVRPTECYVHPSMLEGGSIVEAGMKVKKSGTVIKDHFWIGVG